MRAGPGDFTSVVGEVWLTRESAKLLDAGSNPARQSCRCVARLVGAQGCEPWEAGSIPAHLILAR